MTPEVIRDYFEETTNGDPADIVMENGGPPRAPERNAQNISPVRNEPSLDTTLTTLSPTEPSPVPLHVPHVTFQMGQDMFMSPQLSDSTFEDGIFLPGSQYLELHSALRSRIIDTARSTANSRIASPEPEHFQPDEVAQAVTLDEEDDEYKRLAQLSTEDEYLLWQNYIGEVASWCDKFDNERHFELVLPMLAKSHPHLKYSILALSARQKERQEHKLDYSCSLALYSHAIHLLSPLLQKRTTVELASCVVLAVLEMLSCSPKAWRRHLDGCAALIQALGISGSCGSNLEQALFWTFARMDICGGLISSEKTLIPMSKWMGGPDLLADIAIFGIPESLGRFDMYANHIVYLCGQVVDLLCSSGKWEQRHLRRSNVLDVLDYTNDWTQLFEIIEAWYMNRPDQLKPILTIPQGTDFRSTPFPTLFFGNGPAVSGNQMYHTAALLMLKHKPAQVQFGRKPQSVLWHARQICAISLSNNNHACWTNCIQPLWLAGQQMSHPSEHNAILQIYERIERETGWSTKWRQDDLKEFWGPTDD